MPERPTHLKRLGLILRVWLVPATLVIVSMMHMNQWSQKGRSSWGTGAGFGMFATVDYHGTRFFRCYGSTSQGRLPIELWPDVAKTNQLVAKAIPSKANLHAVIDQLSQKTWFLQVSESGDSFLTTRQPDSPSETIIVDGIDLELWGLRIVAEAKQLESFKINQASTYPRANYVARR